MQNSGMPLPLKICDILKYICINAIIIIYTVIEIKRQYDKVTQQYLFTIKYIFQFR